MSLALTEFEALCDFRPPMDLVSHIESVPELALLLGASPIEVRARSLR
jgi:hypothetical protein